MKTNNIFHLASVRLTTAYLLIIMIISLLFSISFYRVTSLEIERGIRRQGPIGQIIRTARIDLLEDFIKEQNEVIAISKHRLRNNLVLTNIFIFVFGGFLSYYFARRSLKPIEDAHEAQRRFTADASHELRTPIAAMRIETELTLTEPKLTLEQAKIQLKSNLEELDKLTTLSEGLLSLSRNEQDKLETNKIDLKVLLDQAVSRVQKAVNKKQQTLVISKFSSIDVNVDEQNI